MKYTSQPAVMCLLGSLLVLSLTGNAWARIIFQDNFDNDPDWEVQSKRDSCGEAGCSEAAPGEWDFYNNDELWLPPEYPDHHPTSIISNENHMGPVGKAYTHWCESNNGSTGDGWGNDGILAKDLGQDYDELYVQMYIKYQDGFRWRTDPGSGLKQVRIFHWNRQGGVFSFGKNKNTGPVFFFYPGHNSYYDSKFELSLRCSPPSEYYTCGTDRYSPYYYNGPFVGNPAFTNYIGDGKWHKYLFYVKNNSAPGVEDGMVKFWIDDVLQYERYDVTWMSAMETGHVGFNIVAIGGNVNNLFEASDDKKEQWYAIDNVIVSTSPINDDEQGDALTINIKSVEIK